MPVTFAGYQCVDPRSLLAYCEDQRIPVSPWIDRANLFRCPAGRGPGTGAVLLTYADLVRIDRATDHTLTFEDDANPVPLKKLTITRATAVVSGSTGPVGQTNPGEPYRVYLVELADRRLHLGRVPVSRAYNLTDGAGGYWTATKNGGSAWTWQTLFADLWDAVGLLGTAPSLPFTPHGTPEGFDYYGAWTAWGALNDFLERLACVPDYDPVADTVTVKRIGSEPAEETAALTRLDAEPLTWDGDPKDGVRATRPQKVQVLFSRSPAPLEGTSPWYGVDVTLAATAGVVSDTWVQLIDDLAALGATGTPSNSAALGTRAAERAADWLRKYEKRDRRILRVYRDMTTDPGVVVGATATGAGWEDRGNGLRSELESGPDGALERWRLGGAKPSAINSFDIPTAWEIVEGDPCTIVPSLVRTITGPFTVGAEHAP